jgi:FAD/FMN-containing dehydrogenase
MVISRRRFLARSGQVAAVAGLGSQLGWLTGCSEGTSVHWDALGKSLRGRLIRAGDPGYEDAALPNNLRYSKVLPAGIARCADAADVRTAIRWARDNDIDLVARAGGHSYGGYSATRGLMIDVNGMTNVTADPAAGTVRVVGGARNSDLANALRPLDVTVSAGRCPDVGAAGLTLGGGFGFSARKLGLTVDALLETEIVTASGEILTCNAVQNPDLFWACRGGGGGNFGVNTSFTFRTTAVADVAVYRCAWDRADTAALLDAFQRVLATGPDELSMRLAFEAPTDPKVGSQLEAVGQYFGPSANLADLLAPVFAVATPTTREVRDVTYWQGRDLLADNEGPSAFVERSRFIPQPIGSDGLAAFADHLRSRPATVATSSAGAKLFGWGGAIGHVSPAATSFVHRDDLALFAVSANWAVDERPSSVRRLVDWVDEFWQVMGPHTSTRSYQNFIDPALTDWPTGYYGVNLERLVNVKRAVDPTDTFHFAQSIPTRV